MKNSTLSQQTVVIVHNIMSPHVNPVFQRLAQHVKLQVVYCAETERNRTWKQSPTGFDYQVLDHYDLSFAGKAVVTNFINPSLLSTLRDLKPDVVIICGWDLLSYHLTYWYCRAKGIPCLIWSGSTEYELSWLRTVTQPWIQRMVVGAAGCLAYGTRAAEYLHRLGVPAERIMISFNTTDLDMYGSIPTRVKKQAIQLRQRWQWTDKTIILYYGQLIERKGIDTLLQAIHQLEVSNQAVAVLIIGSGPQKKVLTRLAAHLKLNTIKFLADPGDSQMPLYFQLSDVLVLPSREEVWGLVVNQAMSAGLPVIVSDKVGAGPDLVVPGKTGFVFPADNSSDLAVLLEKVVQNPKLRTQMGQVAKRQVQITHPTRSAHQVATMIKRVLTKKYAN